MDTGKDPVPPPVSFEITSPWLLDFGNNKELEGTAEKLKEKVVIVKGSLRIQRHGSGLGDPSIIIDDITSLKESK